MAAAGVAEEGGEGEAKLFFWGREDTGTLNYYKKVFGVIHTVTKMLWFMSHASKRRRKKEELMVKMLRQVKILKSQFAITHTMCVDDGADFQEFLSVAVTPMAQALKPLPPSLVFADAAAASASTSAVADTKSD